jgi:hypothetical protein
MRIITNDMTERNQPCAVLVQRDRDVLVFIPTGDVRPASEGMI